MVKGDNYDHDLGHDYDNGFDLGHLKDIDTSISMIGMNVIFVLANAIFVRLVIRWVVGWVGRGIYVCNFLGSYK